MRCRCGASVGSPSEERTCGRCGDPCCAACAISVESVAYCAPCADLLLTAEGMPTVHIPSAGALVWPRPPRSGELDAPLRADQTKWIILVARDQLDLYDHLARAFAHDAKVEVVRDRRRDYSRNPPGLEERLRSHGAAVVRRKDA